MSEKIYIVGQEKVIMFAAAELQKYLSLMLPAETPVNTEDTCCYKPEKEGIWIGTYDSFGLQPISKETSPVFDDEIYIDTHGGAGIIAGINPRSVLLAVYRFLTEAGCRWIRPGSDGELIPENINLNSVIKLQEKPSYRHRGVCIEGAVSYENLANMIDWIPKVGLNSYFIQFREAFTFLDRWYTHQYNPTKEPELFTVEKARDLVRSAEAEMEKRGLNYHAVGHGWTCEPLGLPGLGWDKYEYELREEFRCYLAEVDGKREIWEELPVNTNLCYSNDQVRKLMVNDILKYLDEHKNVDVLHFWLGDAANNQCECENCQKATPSDFYVQMLNELDEAMTQRNISTKVVFLLYFDLLWAPEVNRINNPDRFILMFAPITRTYSHPYEAKGEPGKTSTFERNKLTLPTSVEDNLAYLGKWQESFTGDSFDFDYHFMWDHYYDPGCFDIAKILYGDIRNLSKIGLNGLVSCQVQRATFPTGLGMYTLAKTLWNSELEFGKIAVDYFKSSFGEDWEKCYKYMETLSELFTPPYFRGETGMVDEDAAKRFDSIKGFMDGFDSVVDRNIAACSGCQKKSWQYLKPHKEIAARLATLLRNRALNDKEKTLKCWDELKLYIQTIEDEVQPVFDVHEFTRTFEIFNKHVIKFE